MSNEDIYKRLKKFKPSDSVIHGPDQEYPNIEYISSGSVTLDLMLGPYGKLCGWPRGMISSVWGQEGTGKTTLAGHFMANAQKLGKKVAVIDTEFKMDREYLQKLGVDVDNNFWQIQPDYGEQGAEMLEQLIRSGEFAGIVIDSIGGLVPQREINGEVGESNPGLRARLVKQMLNKVKKPLKDTNTALFITSQRYSVMGGGGFGYEPQYTPEGGNALKFYAAIKIKLSRAGKEQDGQDVVGIKTRAEIEKNVGETMHKCFFHITYGQGIDELRGLLDLDTSIVRMAGSWCKYIDENGEEQTLGQGKRAGVEFFQEHPDIYESVKRRAVEKWRENNGIITK